MQQQELFTLSNEPLISLEDVFKAYYECRKNKRRTINALKFEMNLEENLVLLWRELNDGTYKIGRSIAFVVKKPVLREVFAADFRDRIVHHLIIQRLGGLLDAAISRNSFSCRKGMGTLYGVKTVYRHLKECTKGFKSDCYVLRLDIRAFFMHIRHDILYKMLSELIRDFYHRADKKIILSLVRQVVYHQSQKHCIIKGKKSDWDKMPKSKSLFGAKDKRGLPIGNLTSQIFANFYLRDFDNFIIRNGVYYGRYVDDMVLMHTEKEILLTMKRKIAVFLAERFHLQLHPSKSILQHCTKGFAFTGAFILPWRLYAGRRLRHAFWKAVKKIPRLQNVLNVLNSYFGFLRHYRTLRLRLKGWNLINMCVDKVYLNPRAVCVFCL